MFMRIATLAVFAATGGPAMAQKSPPLTMTCHPLIRGMPSQDETVYTLVGDTLFSKSIGETRKISTAGSPMYLSRSVDRGVPTLTWASHTRNGAIVTRRVYWKEGSKPRYLRFSETYDFTRQTITGSDDPADTCHHDGR